MTGPRLLRVAPNGDIFIAETSENRLRVLRAADGAEAPAENEVFATGLNRPFGVTFYPPGPEPQWIYVANNNSVVRIPYQKGDLKARDAAQIIVPKLADSTGGHTTRDVAFSKDGKRMFISVGSGSNAGEGLRKKSAAEIRFVGGGARVRGGVGFGIESREYFGDRPEGHLPLHAFATGIRNGVGLVVTTKRANCGRRRMSGDGLGDDLVPDYITHCAGGRLLRWPWYYLGNHEDPRHAGERPDLAGKGDRAGCPVPGALGGAGGFAIYTATTGVAVFPEEYRGDIFSALHGSWNRDGAHGGTRLCGCGGSMEFRRASMKIL